jgi:catechol 2,3-dioxygenase
MRPPADAAEHQAYANAYDAEAHLVGSAAEQTSIFDSFAYAILLFERGEPEDSARAVEIVDALLGLQVAEESASIYGQFPMRVGGRPGDLNAALFAMPRLIDLLDRGRGTMPPSLAERCAAAIRRAVVAAERRWDDEVFDPHRDHQAYTNIFLLYIQALTLGGSHDGDSRLLRKATGQWRRWFNHVAYHGIDEFASPTYNDIDYGALRGIREHTDDAGVRFEADLALDHLCALGHAITHPTLRLPVCGSSRDYRRFLRPGPCEPRIVRDAAAGTYRAPAAVTREYRARAFPHTVRGRATTVPFRFQSWQVERAALGSMTGGNYFWQQIHCLAAVGRSATEREAVFLPGAYTPTGGYVSQAAGTALCVFNRLPQTLHRTQRRVPDARLAGAGGGRGAAGADSLRLRRMPPPVRDPRRGPAPGAPHPPAADRPRAGQVPQHAGGSGRMGVPARRDVVRLPGQAAGRGRTRGHADDRVGRIRPGDNRQFRRGADRAPLPAAGGRGDRTLRGRLADAAIAGMSDRHALARRVGASGDPRGTPLIRVGNRPRGSPTGPPGARLVALQEDRGRWPERGTGAPDASIRAIPPLRSLDGLAAVPDLVARLWANTACRMSVYDDPDRRGRTNFPLARVADDGMDHGGERSILMTTAATPQPTRDREPDPAIHPEARIGHAHLKVADLERALAFYRDVLGFRVMQRYGDSAAFLSAGGYHHHLGLNTWESRGGAPPPPGHTGLYHVAILYPSRKELARALRRLLDHGVALGGASDHGVSEALYLDDPDGNGLELYADRPREEWPRPAGGAGVAMTTRPLDLAGLLAELDEG